ncbi:MAG: hypothetical protein DWQ36_08230 [Acidobacteria bacterium]|nr:MAG: hypothetical protein DWQ30_01955 [Acidobacteriota bacterium]REK08795.1 MAG: hypothetical protein DWQ36_08230 [Acidobacteriota bacterium]
MSAVAAWLVACGVGTDERLPAELEQAMATARYLTSQRFLARSAFGSEEDATPSRLVSYLFSDLGIAEWPIATSELERDQLRATRTPALPRNVALVPRRPDRSHLLQVVIAADDAAGEVVLSAYQNAFSQPLLVERRPMPR